MERAYVRTDRRIATDPEQGGMADLYVRYVPAGIRLAYLLTGDADRAEDLAHEAFIRSVGRFAHLRAAEAFAPYLRRTIVNLHISGLRRLRVEREWLRREGPRVTAAVANLPDVAQRADLWRALEALPPRQRAALVLRYYEDLSERETADILRCSVAAVKSLVARGSEAIRVQLHIDEREGDER